MIVLRLAASELRRISAGRLPKLALFALVIIPTLYAGLYLFANQDPYGRLGEVPAALVVEDRGATSTSLDGGTSTREDYGEQVAKRLLDGDSGFGWVRTTRQDAVDGVRAGRYDSALVIGPSFSADLVSAQSFRPRQASLTLVTNDANNYLASTIAGTIARDVVSAIDSEVGTTATLEFLQAFSTIRDDLSSGLSGTDQLVTGAGELVQGAGSLASGSSEVASGAGETASGAGRLASGADQLDSGEGQLLSGAQALAQGLDTLSARTGALPGQAQALADGAGQVAAGNAQVAAEGRAAAQAAQEAVQAADASRAQVAALLEAAVAEGRLTQAEADEVAGLLGEARAVLDRTAGQIEQASGKLDELSAGAAQVATGASELAGAAPALSEGIASAASGADRLAAGARRLDAGTDALANGLDELRTGTAEVAGGANQVAEGSARLESGTTQVADGLDRLRDGLSSGLQRIPQLDEQTREATARTIAEPVRIDVDALARAGSYGGGLAPFFMSLATWIGAYVLFLVTQPLSVRSVAALGPPWRTAVGAWIPSALIGVLQVAVMLVLVVFALDIRPANWVGTAGLLVLASAAFVAVIQALKVWWGPVGQFLGLVLMLVQLVTAGGTFPWQTIPQPLLGLHRALPMSYTVEGLRQTLYGGDLATAARDAAVLLGVLVLGLAATTVAAHHMRRWTPNRLQPELVL